MGNFIHRELDNKTIVIGDPRSLFIAGRRYDELDKLDKEELEEEVSRRTNIKAEDSSRQNKPASLLNAKEKNLLLNRASKLGAVKAIIKLLRVGAEINKPDINGRFPLHIAARYRQQAAVELLLQHGASINDVDQAGWTALHFATAGGHDKIVEILIRNNAQIEAVDKEGISPIWIASGKGYDSVVKLLVRYKANINAPNKYGLSMLHTAAADNNENDARLLLRNKANVHYPNEYGWTPLHTAVWHDSIEVAALLLQYRANIDAPDRDGYTPLHRATEFNRYKAAQFLLRSGAKPDSTATDGSTPLSTAEVRDNKAFIELIQTYKRRPVQVCTNNNLNHSDDEKESFIRPIKYTELDKDELKEKIDTEISEENVNTLDSEGHSLLFRAVQLKTIKSITKLLELKADVNTSNKDKNGWAPLHQAAYYRNYEIFQLLLQHGAKPDIKTNDGMIAENFGLRNAFKELIQTYQRRPVTQRLILSTQPIEVSTNNNLDNSNNDDEEKHSPLSSFKKASNTELQPTLTDQSLDPTKHTTKPLTANNIHDLTSIISNIARSLARHNTLNAGGFAFIKSSNQQEEFGIIVNQSESMKEVSKELAKLTTKVRVFQNDVEMVKSGMAATKDDVAKLIAEHQEKINILYQQQDIYENTNLNLYYEYSKRLLSSTYITAQVITRGEVQIARGTTTQIAGVIGAIAQQIPVIGGVVGGIITNIVNAIEERSVMIAMHKIAELTSSITEMDLIGEALARKLVNFQSDDLCKLSIDRELGYKEKGQNWINGNPALNAITKLANNHLTDLLTNISQKDGFSLHKSGAFTQKVAEEIADQLVAIILPKYKTPTVPSRLIPGKQQLQVSQNVETIETISIVRTQAVNEIVSEDEKTHDTPRLRKIIKELRSEVIDLKKQLATKEDKKPIRHKVWRNDSNDPQIQILASEEKYLDNNQFYEPTHRRMNELENQVRELSKPVVVLMQDAEARGIRFHKPLPQVQNASKKPVHGPKLTDNTKRGCG